MLSYFGDAIDKIRHNHTMTSPNSPSFLPAESEPHLRTWMCWASTPSVYGSIGNLEAVQENLGALARMISEHEPVVMLASKEHEAHIRQLCGELVEIMYVATDDMWARDTTPMFLRHDRKNKLQAIDLNFNGWGKKQTHQKDNLVATHPANQLGVSRYQALVTGEGGGIEYDGEGTAILTDSCWVNDNRNPGMSQAEIDAELKLALGLEKIIWLPGVRGQDITDGHIDGAFRFVAPGLILASGYEGDDSIWGQTIEESLRILSHSTDAKNRPLETVWLPAAESPRSNHPEMFTSYANFYIGNDALYTPEFGDRKADQRAIGLFETLFPDRAIIALNVDRIYESGGGIHCVTNQQPAT